MNAMVLMERTTDEKNMAKMNFQKGDKPQVSRFVNAFAKKMKLNVAFVDTGAGASARTICMNN